MNTGSDGGGGNNKLMKRVSKLSNI